MACALEQRGVVRTIFSYHFCIKNYVIDRNFYKIKKPKVLTNSITKNK